MIRAGTVAEVRQESGKWIFVDIGFSKIERSCGVAIDNGDPTSIQFSKLAPYISKVICDTNEPFNLLVEAPLSVAFTAEGNPTGRAIERQGSKTRYWYVGLGTTVLLAATYLLRDLAERGASSDVRLFEGFVSFKTAGEKSNHERDVVSLREAVWQAGNRPDTIHAPEQLRLNTTDRLCSAFRVAGMDFGIPPVICPIS